MERENLFDEPLNCLYFVGILAVGDNLGVCNSKASCVQLQREIQSQKKFQAVVKIIQTIVNDLNSIEAILSNWADNLALNLILTTGGTGFGPHEVTPEATRSVIDKEATAMATAITVASIEVTKNAMISRAVCGIRNNVLIVNLPGSVKASTECLRVILPALPTCLAHLTGSKEKEKLKENQEVDLLSLPERYSPTTCSCCENGRQTSIRFANVNQSLTCSDIQTISLINEGKATKNFSHCLRNDDGNIASVQKSLCAEIDTYMDDDCMSIGTFPSSVSNSHFSTKDKDRNFTGSKFTKLRKLAKRPRTPIYPTISLRKALSIVMENSFCQNPVEKIYKDALGYVLADDALAKIPLPSFSSAAIDGYAVRAADTPGTFDVVIWDDAGCQAYLDVRKTIKIKNGSPLPIMADTIIPVEDTLLLREDDVSNYELSVQVPKPVTLGKNVKPKGFEFNVNDVVVQKGTEIGSEEIGIFALAGVKNVSVYRKPTVAILSTGRANEAGIVSTATNQQADSNTLLLLLTLRQHGFEAFDMGIVNDPEELRETILRSFKKADVIVSSGGVSMGDNDYVKPILDVVGATILFGQVAMKPGKPSTFATINTEFGKKYYFGFPGYSVSTFVTSNVFLIPFLRKMAGHGESSQTTIKAKIAYDIKLALQPEYQRVKLRWEQSDSIPWADSTGKQSSSNPKSLIGANALLMLPPQSSKVTIARRGQLFDAIIIDKL